jgi:glycosyltransferase involved in cell wall biosynthesis
VQLYTLVTALRDLGVNIGVIVLNHGSLEQKLRQAGIDVVVLDETELNGFRILLKLIRILREQRPDVIHTHRHKENILGSFAALAAGNIPSLRTVHARPRYRGPLLHIPKRITYLLNWVTGRFLQDRIVSVSEGLAEILAEEFPRSRIRVIENGIDLEDVYRRADQPRAGQHNDTFRIGMVGRLVPVKRVDIFIAAARHLLEREPDPGVDFYVIGDGPLREEMELLSHESGTERTVHFTGHQDDILRHIQDLDALMMTSDYEGLPMVLLEAMALRVPIIAHRTGGIPGLLDQGACGILIDNQDPEAYARATMRLKENPELRSLIADMALTRVTGKYSAKKNAQAFLEEYTALMGPMA